MVKAGDLVGDGVNIAARLQALAEPGGVYVSSAVHGHVRKVLPLAYEDLGPQQVKNIDEQVRVFAIRVPGLSTPEGSKVAPVDPKGLPA
jgi:adenylate cyclase